jgi:RNA polymerase sigma factor (sigma-70 family)
MKKVETASKIQHAELVQACRFKEPKACEKIYNLYCNAMFNASYRIVNNDAEAEDIMQEAFIEGFEKIDTFREEGEFGAWLKRIVINRSINHLRSKKQIDLKAYFDDNIPDENADEENYSENIFCRIEEIREAMKKLPQSYRIIISLHLLEGYDHDEISQVLDISYQNARTRYSRAKQKLLQLIMQNRNENNN